jgi:integrase
MAKSHLRVVAPTEVKRTVPPKRAKNATMILLTYLHGLRAAEVCDLRRDQVDFNSAVLHVRRVKNGAPSTHPIQGDELRALRRLHRESRSSPFVLLSERGLSFMTAPHIRARRGPELARGSRPAAPCLRLFLREQGHDTCAIQR